MFGWMGTVLRVDLSTGKIEKGPLDKELACRYLGGRGINVRILYDELAAGTDALSPENVLIFGAGPLTGAPLPAGRLHITAMSPLTNILGDSNAGSHFSSELKFAGYDHIVFKGKADKPVYLWIDDDRVELRDAAHLWGKLTDEAQEAIKAELGDPDVEIACIGPAGENLVRLAAVVVGGDGVCGKCGLAAVMGSKNLKAVAVRGTKGIKVADPHALRNRSLELMQQAMRNPNYRKLSTFGTKQFFGPRNLSGGLTMRNGQESGAFWGCDELRAETLRDRYVVKDKGCFGCANHCRDWFQIKEGPYAGLVGVGVEVSALEAWGPLLSNPYAPSIYKAFILCNQYGLEEIECGQLIALATEWYQMGLITKGDTEGIELGWGNYEGALAMIPKIANRQGIGDLLAEDAVRAAQQLGRGAEKCFTHSKGALKTNVDLRSSPVYAFAHAVSTRGADHLRGAIPAPVPPGVYEGVARQVVENTYACTLADSLQLCKFSTPFMGMGMTVAAMADIFSLTTGVPVDEAGMREIADRIGTLERAFIVREGITRKDDFLVGRYMDGPVHGGPLDGLAFDRQKWNAMLDEYYSLLGWEIETGIPTRKTLETLGLAGVAGDLERLGKLRPMATDRATPGGPR